MNILVTGSSGRLGSAVVRDLLNHGHQVVPVDIQPANGPDLPPTRQVDLRHIDQLKPLMAGVDAVCHLGNLPGFQRSGRADGFANNVSSTYNVFFAAFEAGVRKIVYASSIQVYGAFGEFRTPPQYLPMDEDHPHLPRDAYALSKATGEQIALAFARRDPKLQVLSLRFTGIHSVADARFVVGRMASRPPGSPFSMGSLGTYIRAEDAATAVRLSCQIDRPGHTALNIVASRPMCACTVEMVESFFSHRPVLKKPLGPDDLLIPGDLAREVLGFVAEMPLLAESEKAEPPSKELKAAGSAAA